MHTINISLNCGLIFLHNRHGKNIIPIIYENKDNYPILLNVDITNASDDASRDDEVETMDGDKVDSLVKAALDC